jgi:ribosomal protein S18 acetylase RimI-like enzyme
VTEKIYREAAHQRLQPHTLHHRSKQKMDTKTFEWERTIASGTYLISSDRSLLPYTFVQDAFASEAMFWAKPLSFTTLSTMLDNSLTLGVYSVSNDTKTPIGMARMITDYTTLAYLTDVYLVPEHQGQGIGKWLIQCCREICTGMENLRFMVLLTASEQAQALYRRELGMAKLDGVEEGLVCMGARRAKLSEAAAGAPPSA